MDEEIEEPNEIEEIQRHRESNQPDDMSDSENDNLLNLEDIIQPLVGANCSDYAVAHANVDVTPFLTFAEVSLLPDIVQKMRKWGLNRLQRLQSYAWPHILNGPGHGVLIVSAPRSGRTMGYVPPICHIVSTTLAAHRHSRESAVDLMDISHGMGPIALILVPDLKRMEQVAALCRALMPWEKAVEDMGSITVKKVLTVPSQCTPTFMAAWISEMGVLVSSPARFVNACKQGEDLLKLNQLQVVVIDDADLMQKEELALAKQYIPGMVGNTKEHHNRATRKCYPRPQVVMVCQHFTPSLVSEVRRFNPHPCVIFGDLLEAALYGGMRLLVHMVGAKEKVAAIVNLLRQRPPEQYRTIIFCDGDVEMALLVGALADFEYKCLAYYQTMDLEQLDKVSSWICDTGGVIFLCTDNCLELKIRNAHTLIHNNMSKSWGIFKNRFMFLSDNVLNGRDSAKAAPPPMDRRILDSLVLLDEKNARQLPRLVDFMQLRRKLDPNIVALADRIRKEANTRKNIVKPICREILGHGDCWDTKCVDRHYLHESDRRLPAVPNSGDIKVKVVRVYSPGHYCVIVYEHMPLEGKWSNLEPDSNLPALLNLKLSEKEPPPRYWPPQQQAVCLWKTASEAVSGYDYERVRVLSVPPIENVNLAQSNLVVLVQAMDYSTRRFETKCISLHVCPDEYLREPPLCMDLRILGMVSHMGERNWPSGCAKQIQDWLNKAPEDHFVQAKVEFSTSDTIFVTCMSSIVYLKTVRAFNLHLNLLRAQIEAKISKRCARTKERILKFFEELNQLEPPEQEQDPSTCERVRVVANELHQEDIAGDKSGEKSSPLEQDTPKLPARFQRIMDQIRKDNILRQERSQEETDTEKAKTETTKPELEPKQSQRPATPIDHQDHQPKASESEDSDLKVVPMSDFYECFMRCVALDHLEEMEKMAPVQRIQEPKEEKSQQELIPECNDEKLYAQTKVRARNAARILRSASRPDVKYFQTFNALHLQVTLVDEKMSYRARVISSTTIFFKATPTAKSGLGSPPTGGVSNGVNEFCVNTPICFKGIKCSMKGRTVYIELQKTIPGYYPTQFVHLKFFEPNYDKIVVEERWNQQEKIHFDQLMVEHGWGVLECKARKQSESSDEAGSETESEEDGVERPENYRKIDMT